MIQTVDYYIEVNPIDCELCSISQCSEDMQLGAQKGGIGLKTFQPNEQWTVIKTWVESGERMCASNLKFFIHLQRKPQFFLINVVLPIMILSAMTLTAFWLPCDAGEKVGLAVTTLLAYTVFQLVVSELLPETSGTPPLLSESCHTRVCVYL